MDRGAWWAAVHGVTKSWTRLSDFTFTFHFHALEKEMATHSSVLAWRIPGMAETGGLPSVGSHRVRHDWHDLAAGAVIKQIHGPLVPFQGLQIISWAIPCELLWRYWNLHYVEELTTLWPDHSHDISHHSSENWSQRNRDKLMLELKTNYLKQSRWCWSEHQGPIWRWLPSWLCYFFMLPSLYKISCPLIVSWGELPFGQKSTLPTTPNAEIKQYFTLHQKKKKKKKKKCIGFWVSIWTLLSVIPPLHILLWSLNFSIYQWIF